MIETFRHIKRPLLAFFLIFSLLFQQVGSVYAATSPWTQTDWSGGSGQTSFIDATKFSSSSNTFTSTAGQVTLGVNVGDGADGAVTISSTKTIDTDAISTGRTYPDAVNFGITTNLAVGATSINLGSTANGIVAGDEVLIINLRDPNNADATSYGYLVSGTATSGTSTTLVDSGKSWTTNAYATMIVAIVSGTGQGQQRTISSNDATSITVSSSWTTTPDSTSNYKIMDPNAWTNNIASIKVGQYETRHVTAVSTNTITLDRGLTNAYDGTTYKIMVQRIPQYTDVTVQSGGTLTVSAYNNTTAKGGVLFFRANGTVTVDSGGSISASGKGYAGGAANTNGGMTYNGSGGTGGGNGTALPGSSGQGGAGGGGNLNGKGAAGTTGGAGGGGGYGGVGAGGGYGTVGSVGSNYAGSPGIAGSGNIGGNGGDASTWGGGGGGGGTYGIADLSKIYFGSGGGASQSNPGGSGGGILYIRGNSIQIFGNIYSDGAKGNNGTCVGVDGSAGASGGSISLSSSSITLGTSLVTAAGGNGKACGHGTGGNGGVGRIAVYSPTSISGTTSPTYGTGVAAYAESGTLISSIFDTEFSSGAAWGTLSYTSSGSTVAVKARTSNSSSMSGATDFSSCTAITSGTDISSNSCVTDSHRYIQYQVTLSTTDSSSTPTFSDISIAFAIYDDVAPSLSLTAFSPDPTTDTTPTLSGTTTDSINTISTVQFQMDSTSGSWSSCTADDGTFDEAIEPFTCTPSALSDGDHTLYVRATDSNGNTTGSGSELSDVFTIDATAPTSIDLDSPGNNSYTNSERPTFKWKATTDATAGLSKYVLEVDNPSAGSGQASGDFTIDDIPTSRTTDYETNKYVIHYDNFNDSDSTNNYIFVWTKSSSDWGTSENDGKLREGKVNWKVKARDNAGNETSSSRNLFVDRTNPKVEFTQINDVTNSCHSESQTKNPGSSGSFTFVQDDNVCTFSTTDKTPTIFGKITDPLSAPNSSSATQNDDGPKVASGPKQVDIKIEKKEGFTYNLHTLYTINMDKLWYTCDDKEITDNSKQKCDKYSPFEFTPENSLDFGTYLVTITGKDKADNASSSTSFTLNIGSLAQVVTREEEEIVERVIEEEFPEATKQEKEQLKEELEITKTIEPTALEKATAVIPDLIGNLYQYSTSWIPTFVGMTNKVAAGIGERISMAATAIGEAIAYDFTIMKNNIIATGYLISNISSYIAQVIGNTYTSIAHNAPGIIGDGMEAVGNGITQTGTAIAQGVGNTTKAVKGGIANAAFFVGENTQNASESVGFAFVKFGYLFVNEPTTISNVGVKIISPTKAKISWETNHPANGKVNYGLDETYPFDVQTEKRTTHHEFTLTKLKPGTEYYFEVMSQNKNYVYDANRKFKTTSVVKK